MAVKKGTWITVGIFLWGIPTGFFMAFFWSMLKPGVLFELQAFQQDLFIQKCYIMVPIFALAGFFYGILMSNITKRK